MALYKSEELTDIEKKVLKWLAEEGKTTGYAISRKKNTPNKIPEPTAHDVLERLEGKNLARVVLKQKQPREKTIYDLTLPGLLLYFSAEENWINSITISEVIKLHHDLIPVVFGNWSYFVSAIVGDKVIKLLHNLFGDKETAQWLFLAAKGKYILPRATNEAQGRSFEYTYPEIVTKRVLFEPIQFAIDPTSDRIGEYAVEELITRYVIFYGLDPRLYLLYEFKVKGKPKVDFEIIKWMMIVSRNEELKNYAIRYLKACQEDFQRRLLSVNKWEDLIRISSGSKSKKYQVDNREMSKEEEKLVYELRRRLFHDF